MPDVLQLFVAGLATGAIYALAAIGFTLLWQTSQTINFAQGEFVMLPAFIVLFAMNVGLPFPAAILVGIAASLIVLGFLFKQAAVDQINRHGALPLAIATIALGLLIKEGVKDFTGAAAQPFPPLGGTASMLIGDALLPIHSLVAIVVAVAAVAGLQGFLDRTPLGRSIQATVQNPAVARVIGIPVERMIRYAFLINAALTALASILVTPVYLASFANGEWLGLCTFVAALGGLNLRGAIVGGLALGFIDNLAAAYLSATWRGALPLLILIAVVLFRPQGLLGRSEEPRRVNRATSRYAVAGVGALVLIAVPFGLTDYGNYVLSLWALTTIAAIGLNVTFGYVGQVSLGQGAFVGIGAYVTALLTPHGWPLPAAYVLAFAACFALGWGLGYRALRVRRPYLPFITLAFGAFAFLVFRNEEWLTGGVYGINRVPRPSFLGLSTAGPLGFCYFCLLNLAVVAAAVWWLRRSPWGRAFAALRANPLRAETVGIDTRLYTLIAIALGAALGGVAGVLYAPLLQYVDPTPFSLTMSVSLLLMVAMGGAGRLLGPFLGAAAAVVLPEGLRFAQDYYLFGYALAAMILMAFCPTGLIGIAERLLTMLTQPSGAPAKAPP